jgi:hypothetical protein
MRRRCICSNRLGELFKTRTLTSELKNGFDHAFHDLHGGVIVLLIMVEQRMIGALDAEGEHYILAQVIFKIRIFPVNHFLGSLLNLVGQIVDFPSGKKYLDQREVGKEGHAKIMGKDLCVGQRVILVGQDTLQNGRNRLFFQGV